MYRIREVDVLDEEVIDLLTDLHRATFLGSAAAAVRCRILVGRRRARRPCGLRRDRSVGRDARLRIFLPGRGDQVALWPRLAAAADACPRTARVAERLARGDFRYDQQRRLGE